MCGGAYYSCGWRNRVEYGIHEMEDGVIELKAGLDDILDHQTRLGSHEIREGVYHVREGLHCVIEGMCGSSCGLCLADRTHLRDAERGILIGTQNECQGLREVLHGKTDRGVRDISEGILDIEDGVADIASILGYRIGY